MSFTKMRGHLVIEAVLVEETLRIPAEQPWSAPIDSPMYSAARRPVSQAYEMPSPFQGFIAPAGSPMVSQSSPTRGLFEYYIVSCLPSVW